jgi:hypothetical protein
LAVWQEEDILLDGHHRIEICADLGIPYTTRAVSLPDRDAARAWIAEHQLGRRNSPEAQKSYLRGLLLIQNSKSVGRPSGPKDSGSGIGATVAPFPGRTSERLAEQHGVSTSTMKNDARFARDVDAVAQAVGDGGVREVLTSGKATRAEVHALAGKDREEIKREVEEIKSRPRKKRRPKRAASPRSPEKTDPPAVPAENERREPPVGSAGGEGLRRWPSNLRFHAGLLEDLALRARRLRKTRAAERQVDRVRDLANDIRKAAERLEEDFLGAPDVLLRRYLTALVVGRNDGSLEGLLKIPAEAWGLFTRDDPGAIKRVAEGCEALAAFLRKMGC